MRNMTVTKETLTEVILQVVAMTVTKQGNNIQ